MKSNNTIGLVEIMFKIFRYMKGEMSYTDNLIHLSILQIQTLVFLGHNKTTSMSDIAGHFHIELSSATSLVNKLCDLQLVERREDTQDRRLVMIALTSKGKALLKQAMVQRRKKLEKMLSYLSEKEQTDLLTILETLHKRIQS